MSPSKTCESDIRIEEMDLVVSKMTLNKSPGIDGLTTHFYQFFWKELRDFVFRVLEECFDKKELTP